MVLKIIADNEALVSEFKADNEANIKLTRYLKKYYKEKAQE